MRLAAALAIAALLAAAGCGSDEEEAPNAAGADYAREVEAIVENRVLPNAIAASDEVTNVLQGAPAGPAAKEIARLAEAVATGEAQLAMLEPPPAAAGSGGELVALVGGLAQAMKRLGTAELAREGNGAAATIGAYQQGISALGDAVEALAVAPAAQAST